MPANVYGERVEKALEVLLERRGADAPITQEEAKDFFGGKKATTLGALSKHELLQVALLDAYFIMELMLKDLEALAKSETPAPNRAQRRAKK